MGCCAPRHTGHVVSHTFDYIDIGRFHSRRSCWARITYAWVFVRMIIEVLVLASDCYTAVLLLAYNKWSSQINPKVPLTISKWIFAGCIIFSFVLYIYSGIVAFKVIKSRNIALAYTDSLSTKCYCFRNFNYHGVFLAITKSKRNVDYIALYTNSTLKDSLRLLVAEGPRQAINAMTLYSVLNLYDAQNLFANIRQVSQQSTVQFVVLLLMAFTLTIWSINMVMLITAFLFYIPLLCYVRGRLGRYCRFKVDKRITRLVEENHKKSCKQIAMGNLSIPRPTLPEFRKQDEALLGRIDPTPPPSYPPSAQDWRIPPSPSSVYRGRSHGARQPAQGDPFYMDRGDYFSQPRRTQGPSSPFTPVPGYIGSGPAPGYDSIFPASCSSPTSPASRLSPRPSPTSPASRYPSYVPRHLQRPADPAVDEHEGSEKFVGVGNILDLYG